MGWVHDTGYQAAYRHEGSVFAILDDGTEHPTASFGERVASWRAGCACEWRGQRVHLRADYPDDRRARDRGMAPDAVDGFDGDGQPVGGGPSCFAEWDAHVHEVLPELALHDLIDQQETTSERIAAAVRRARAAGVSWGTIGEAADMSRQSAHERWRHLENTALDPTALAPEARTRREPDVHRWDTTTRLEEASATAMEDAEAGRFTEAHAPALALALRRTAAALADAAPRDAAGEAISPGMALHDIAEALGHLAEAAPHLAGHALDEDDDDEWRATVAGLPRLLRDAAAGAAQVAANAE